MTPFEESDPVAGPAQAHASGGTFDSCAYQPRTTVSRDGSKLVFTSNQDLQAILGYPALYSDVYMVTVGSSPQSPAPPSSSDPTPAPTPAPAPNPAPSASPAPAPTAPPSSGATYFEQSNSAVTYTGSWSPNALPAHSGGSAKLAMDAGSRASFYTVSGLPNGTHTLTIEATGTHGAASAGSWIWVDAFAVTR